MLKYDILPEHMRHGMKLYIEKGIPGGDFMTAVLENNLVEAFQRADNTNLDHMTEWARFLYWEMPSEAWGSPEKVQAWIDHRGMEGKQ